MRPRTLRFLALLLAVGCPLGASFAVSVRRWAPATPEAFAAGSIDGLSIGDRGLVLAPPQETWWGPEPGVVWSVAVDRGGAVFAAVTEPPSVVRLNGAGSAEDWFAPADPGLVTALSIAGRGAVLAGVSEPARVVEIAAPGESSDRWVGEAQYVWGVAEGTDGALWIATGAPGQVVRAAGSESKTLWRPDDDPVRCLAVHPGGGVVAGTGRNGIVARVRPDGVYVLLDAEQREIVAVRVAPDGAVYALASSASLPVPSRKRSTTATEADRSGSVGNDREPQPRVTVTVTPGPANLADVPRSENGSRTQGGGGALYRIAPNGDVVELWSSSSLVPYALELDGADALVGTGETGRILRVHPDGTHDVVLRIPSGRATALAVAEDGRVLAGGGSDARIVRIGPGTAERGTYLSEAVDAGWIADWGEVSWSGRREGGGSVELAVRSGNTSDPDDTWTTWKTLGPAAPGEPRSSEAGPSRWLQLRVRLEAARRGGSPVVSALELFYRPRNRPPRIETLSVEDPGIAWHRGPAQSGTRYGALVSDDPVAEAARRSLNGSKNLGPIRKSYEPGVRTFTWSVLDPDGDPVRAAIEFRAEGQETWFPVARDIEDDFFSWDARAVPDGRYRVRLTVDDTPGNVEGAHGRAARESDPFALDRTPPVMDVRTSTANRVDVVRIDASDPGGAVASLEYSLDGGAWQSVEPADGVHDGPRESYRIELSRGASEVTRKLALRITDRSGNVSGVWRMLGDEARKGSSDGQ